MSTPTQQQTTNGQSAPAEPALDLNGRAAQIAQRLASSEPAPDADAAPQNGASPAPAAAAPEADSDEARAKARRERLQALSAEDRQRVDHKAKLVEQDKATQRAAELEKRLAEAEARANARIDRNDIKDPVRAFAIMQEEGIPPQRIAEALREAIANPDKFQEARAREEAKKVVDPYIKSLEEKIAALEKRDADRESAWQQHQQHLAFQRAASECLAFTKENAAISPYAARLAEADPQGFIAMAEQKASGLPPGSGFQPVLDLIEEDLTKYGPQLAAIFGVQAPASSKAKAPPSRAAAQANTVSNRDATARTTVVDGEEDLSSLTLEERAERLVKRLAGSS